MSNASREPNVPPRVLQAVAVFGLLVCLSGAAYIAYDAYLGLTTGNIHLSRNPVSRSDGGRFWFHLVGELVSVVLLLGGVALTGKIVQLSRGEMSHVDGD
jgi:hypothetical protein